MHTHPSNAHLLPRAISSAVVLRLLLDDLGSELAVLSRASLAGRLGGAIGADANVLPGQGG